MPKHWVTILASVEGREKLNEFKDKHRYSSQEEAWLDAIRIADEIKSKEQIC